MPHFLSRAVAVPVRGRLTAVCLALPIVAGPLADRAGAQIVQTIPSWSGVEEAGGAFGASIGGTADLDADARADFIVGAPGETSVELTQGGRVYVHSGRIGLRLFTLESPRNEPFGNFGWSVAGVADIDADGKGDFAIGAPNENPGPLPDGCGRAYVYRGTGVLRFILGSPDSQTNGRFGWCVSGVPDVNGDGRGDVIVGAPGEATGASPGGAGRAYVYSGGTGGRLLTLTAPVEEGGASFGWSVAGIPDVNGDGRGDVIVSAPWADGAFGVTDSGVAYVFSGATGAVLRTLQSPGFETGGRFGWSVAGVADANGDGRGDVMVGAPFEDPGLSPADNGRAYVYSGATGALLRKLIPPQQALNGNFGYSVAGTNDVNNDGRGDLIVGARGEAGGSFGAGRVHVYSGASGLKIVTIVSPAFESGGAFGTAVAGIPDANLNTRSDVLVGAPAENPGSSPAGAGRAYLLKF
ncbi:MAG: integrin alpha [Phycisphaerales bacterium]